MGKKKPNKPTNKQKKAKGEGQCSSLPREKDCGLISIHVKYQNIHIIEWHYECLGFRKD